jgi:hypothetical protein
MTAARYACLTHVLAVTNFFVIFHGTNAVFTMPMSAKKVLGWSNILKSNIFYYILKLRCGRAVLFMQNVPRRSLVLHGVINHVYHRQMSVW